MDAHALIRAHRQPSDGRPTGVEFTGERFVPELKGSIALEHLHRYLIACELARGVRVLDIACGEGYGSAMLAEVARHVIGVDISDEVIAHASSMYGRANLEFKVGTCAKIPVPDASVDLVVSFETIEHHDQHQAMMSEIKRVLRPEGVLIISSPDQHEYSKVLSCPNPFHVKELRRDEFENLLRSAFRHFAMFGQRVVYASGIVTERDASALVSFTEDGGRFNVDEGIARPLYLVAVASDGSLPRIGSSLFERPITDSEAVRAATARIAALTEELARRDATVLRLGSELQEQRSRLQRVLHSNSWRITLPLREARRWVTAPKAQFKRYAEAASRRLGRAHEAPASAGAGTAEDMVPSRAAEPVVSVVIVSVPGSVGDTLRCLQSIERNPPTIPYEVIIVGDAPPAGLPSHASDIRVIANGGTPAFVESCNIGARQARGRYLLFLRNETEVAQDWMAGILRTFDAAGCEASGVKIAAVTMVYNEALVLPYFLRHYRYLDEIHVLYETDSTDRSLEILMGAPNVVIEKGHIEGGLDDIAKIDLFNKAVQRIKADWVYVVDPDELIFPPNGESPYSFLRRQRGDVVRSGMYQVYRHRNDSDLDPSLPPIPQRAHGDPDLFGNDREANRAANSVYVKPNVVRPSGGIRFLPGHHQIDGNPAVSAELYLGAHWQMADPSIAIARRMERKARVSRRNKAHKMGWQHFDISVHAIQEECDRHLDDPVIDALASFRDGVERPNGRTAPASGISRRTGPDGGRPERFDPLQHPICFSSPRRTVPLMSWRQHVPFAMLLVDLLRPRTFVELGVHYGDSYCAFCQAVDELRLPTACYGVDTWQGDPHASFYGPEVLADLAAHHDPLYGAFSHLVRSTFDEALPRFSDGAIDILHIDGYHTYEAVKHDFQAWLPKVSAGGVILFHDISEKQQDFGVWRLWEELKLQYPHFEFLHCHGLGLIAPGKAPPDALKWLFEADPQKAAAIRNFFFCLGDRLTDKAALSPGSELESLLAARNELQAVRSSPEWRIARKLRALGDAALPVNSKRRAFARRILGRIGMTSAAAAAVATDSARQGAPAPADDDVAAILHLLSQARPPEDLDRQDPLDVVVPIFNAYDDLLKCLRSLLEHQDVYRILLIDDCSTDARVDALLRRIKSHQQEWFKLEQNPLNLGYLKTVNKGLGITKHDVILLNTDTIVTANWARKMRACARSDSAIATVTPFTNNGRMCSVPEFLENNRIPAGFTVDSFAECVEKASSNRYPDLVTGVGFCMYIRRKALEEIGCFDDLTFGTGYGEEVDFSFRAARKGYRNVLCDNTFVYHKGQASFLDTQVGAMERHHRALAQKYPDLWSNLARFERSNPLKALHGRLKREMRSRGHVWRRWATARAGMRPAFLRLSRRIYTGLPVSPRVRARLAGVAFRLAGPLFEGVIAYDEWKRERYARRQARGAAHLRGETRGPRDAP